MPNPFDLHRFVMGSLAENDFLSQAAGLNTLSSTLSRDLYSQLTGKTIAEHLREQHLGTLSSLKNELLQCAKSALGVADHLKRMNKSRADMLLGDFAKLESARSSIHDALGPLSTMRSVALYEEEIEKFKKYAAGPLGYLKHSDLLGQVSPAEQIRKQYEHLITNVGQSLTERWTKTTREFASYFSEVGGLGNKPQDLWSSTQNLNPGQLAHSLGVPTMDRVSLEVIARVSGTQGLFDHLKVLGVDAHLLRALASSVTDDEEEVDDLVGKFDDDEPKPASGYTVAQVHLIWAIIFTLYQVLFPMYQQWDSNQAEARITQRVELAEERIAQRIESSEQRSQERFEEALAKMLACTMEAAERVTLDAASMVVQHRVAAIRRKAESGAGVVAEVFPNQVVTLVSEDGQWIRVKYFDWLAGEEREGWSLKKYYVRVAHKAPKPRQNFDPKLAQVKEKMP